MDFPSKSSSSSSHELFIILQKKFNVFPSLTNNSSRKFFLISHHEREFKILTNPNHFVLCFHFLTMTLLLSNLSNDDNTILSTLSNGD